MKFLTTLVLVILMASTSFGKEVVLQIADGTADHQWDWNDSEEPIVATVGDTLTIVNNDSKTHRFHAVNDLPCEHGEPILPGESWSCVLENEYNSFTSDSPIYDHLNPKLKIWLIIRPQPIE